MTQLWPTPPQFRELELDASEVEDVDSLATVDSDDVLSKPDELTLALDDETVSVLELSREGVVEELSVDELVVGSLTLLKDVDSVWLSVPDSLEDSEIDVV